MGKDNFAKALAAFLGSYTQASKEKKQEMKEEERWEKLFGLQKQQADIANANAARDAEQFEFQKEQFEWAKKENQRQQAQLDADIEKYGMTYERYMDKQRLDQEDKRLQIWERSLNPRGGGGGESDKPVTKLQLFQKLSRQDQMAMAMNHPGGLNQLLKDISTADAASLTGAKTGNGSIGKAPGLADVLFNGDPQTGMAYQILVGRKKDAEEMLAMAMKANSDMPTPDTQKAVQEAILAKMEIDKQIAMFEEPFLGQLSQGQQQPPPSQGQPKAKTPKTPEKRTNLQNTPINASPVLRGMAAVKDKPMAERGIGENLMALPYPMLNLFMNAGKSVERALLGLSPEAVLPGQEGLSGAIDPYGINPEKIQQYRPMFGTPYMFPWQR